MWLIKPSEIKLVDSIWIWFPLFRLELNQQRIGGAFLDTAPRLKELLTEYCLNHPSAVSLLNSKRALFEEFLKKRDLQLKELISGLSLVFRHIEKYAVVLQEIERNYPVSFGICTGRWSPRNPEFLLPIKVEKDWEVSLIQILIRIYLSGYTRGSRKSSTSLFCLSLDLAGLRLYSEAKRSTNWIPFPKLFGEVVRTPIQFHPGRNDLHWRCHRRCSGSRVHCGGSTTGGSEDCIIYKDASLSGILASIKWIYTLWKICDQWFVGRQRWDWNVDRISTWSHGLDDRQFPHEWGLSTTHRWTHQLRKHFILRFAPHSTHRCSRIPPEADGIRRSANHGCLPLEEDRGAPATPGSAAPVEEEDLDWKRRHATRSRPSDDDSRRERWEWWRRLRSIPSPNPSSCPAAGEDLQWILLETISGATGWTPGRFIED